MFPSELKNKSQNKGKIRLFSYTKMLHANIKTTKQKMSKENENWLKSNNKLRD